MASVVAARRAERRSRSSTEEMRVARSLLLLRVAVAMEESIWEGWTAANLGQQRSSAAKEGRARG